MQNLTLEEIGRRAGVSRSTVSRVINNQESVSDAVRQRVLQVIKETGYQPHAAARSLAAQRTHIIGLVIPRSVQSIFTDPYFPLLIQGIVKACNAHQYTLSLFMFHSEAEEKELYPRVVSRSLTDGVIIASSQAGDPLIPRLLQSHMPFVLIGRPLDAGKPRIQRPGVEEQNEASYVDVDNVVGARNAVTHLVRHGRQRIGHIAGSQKTSVGVDRRQGYIDTLMERGLPVRDEWIVEGDFLEASGYLAAQKLLARGVDAIFAASDKMAFGAQRALREAGLGPADVAVVGFDNLEDAATAQVPLTTVRQPIRQIGVIAVETLLDLIENRESAPQRVLLPTQLIVRESCGSNYAHFSENSPQRA